MDNFTLVVIIISAIFLIIGVYLLVKQRLPGLGFFLVIFAIALLIGIGMEPEGFKHGIQKAMKAVSSII